jgi:hypothetical protein
VSLISDCVAFNIGTAAAGNTVVVNHALGEKPRALLLLWNGNTGTTNTAGSANWMLGAGFACYNEPGGTPTYTNGGIASRDEDGLGTSNSDKGQNDANCVIEMGDGATVGLASLTGVSTTTFTLTINTQFTTNFRVVALLWAGSDLPIADGVKGGWNNPGVVTPPIAQNIVAHAGSKVCFILTGGHTSTPPSVAVDSTTNLGAIVGSSSAVLSVGSNSAATSGQAGSYCLTGECLATNNGSPASAPGNRASGRIESDGPYLDWIESTNSHRYFYMSIAGGQWEIGTKNSLDSVTTTTIVPGFDPVSLLLVSANTTVTVADATPSTHAQASIGSAVSVAKQFTTYAGSRSGNTNMFTQVGYRTDAVYMNIDPTTDSLVGVEEVSAWSGNTITLNQSDADPSAAFQWYVVGGNASAATVKQALVMMNQAIPRASVY